MKKARTHFVFWFIAIFCSLTFQTSAGSMHWRFTKQYSGAIDIKLFPIDRPAYSWPGKGKVYTMSSPEEWYLDISCRTGEKICYGASPRNGRKIYWGVGLKNEYGCKGCCYFCNGGKTRLIELR
ncbi:hypothetical protein [uncultured Cohaesibacter sp.]|uniref:hypothetical protein n=1 Tax=uncultured Cohaesibacter sp. TaxID=1002546 RepID=UPI00292F2C67|nr:hypothetical protein [uncultured Cohaesibacter sp.]